MTRYEKHMEKEENKRLKRRKISLSELYREVQRDVMYSILNYSRNNQKNT